MPKYVPKKCTFPPGRSGYPSSSWLLGSPQSTSQFKFFYGLGVYVTHFASARQIWRRPVKPLLRYCDFLWVSRRWPLPPGIFENSKTSRSVRCKCPMCVSMPNFIKVVETVAEIWRFNGFQNIGRPLSCWVRIWPPTMSTWWSLVLCKIWLVGLSMQHFW